MNYQKPKGEIIKFGNQDVLTGSNCSWGTHKESCTNSLGHIIGDLICNIFVSPFEYKKMQKNDFLPPSGPNNDPFGGLM